MVSITGVMALASAGVLLVRGIRLRTLSSPLMLLGIPLMLSLAAATQPITRIFSDWSSGNLALAILIVLAPLLGVAVAILATDGRIPALERGGSAMPRAERLVAACYVLTLAATVVLATEFARIGGPPLLSSNIDQARFSQVENGPLHLITDGLPIALLIATWARVGRPGSFSSLQRRLLEVIIGSTPVMMMLGGGRITVIMPLLTALIVAARYMTPNTSRRLMVGLPIALLVFSSAIFLTRVGQHASQRASQTVLYNSSTGQRSSPIESAYEALSLNLGEQLRVVSELRGGHAASPPFTSSLWFIHHFLNRAINPEDISRAYAGGWRTASYAQPLLLDFGVIPALLFGVMLGVAAHALYRRFARGSSVTVIWVYAYLAGPIAASFYANVFLTYVYPLVDAVVLIALSRVLVKTPGSE